MRSSKVFACSFRYHRPIPRSASSPHTCLMETPTTEQLETMREIDDLHDQIKNLRLQNDYAAQQLRTLCVRCNRYEHILGMDDEQEAA
jgi:hypothetical protein